MKEIIKVRIFIIFILVISVVLIYYYEMIKEDSDRFQKERIKLINQSMEYNKRYCYNESLPKNNRSCTYI